MLRVIIKINKCNHGPGALLAALALAILCATSPVRAQGEGDLRRAVALLDYVAGDYGHAVGPGGAVLDPGEFEEQQGFVRDAAREVRSGGGTAGAALADQLDQLAALVDAKAPPAQVSQQARALREEIAQRFRVAILPGAPPDLARGAALYAQSCAACHGLDGRPPAPEVLKLSTRAVAFVDKAQVAELSPQRAFAGVTYGVPGTAMPAYDEAYDDAARWDLAFYVLSLAHPAHDSARGLGLARAALVGTGYRALAPRTDAQLAAQLALKGLSPADTEEALAALRAGPFADEPQSRFGFEAVRRALQSALVLAQSGDREGAGHAVISAYLDLFEPVEPALRARDPQLLRQIEAAFLSVRQALDPRAQPQTESAGDAVARLDALLESASALRPGGGLVAFFAALAIALREGVEAALLVALMLALLRRNGREAGARAIHFGWSAALLAGAGTWFVSGAVLGHLPGASRELTEGAVELLTAALLLYASHWVLASASAKKLVGFISAKTLASGSALVVFWLAFGAVYREMLEVVIFFRGLLFEAPGAGRAVLAGALVGLALLALFVFLFQGLGKKLKARPLLLTCGVILCGLAVVMVGNGVHALQEAGAVRLTVWGAFQLPQLGAYATREGLVAQGAVLVGLAASALWTVLRGRAQEAKRHTAAHLTLPRS